MLQAKGAVIKDGIYKKTLASQSIVICKRGIALQQEQREVHRDRLIEHVGKELGVFCSVKSCCT